jgi:tetratricopeptide (TPR) repeat protein
VLPDAIKFVAFSDKSNFFRFLLFYRTRISFMSEDGNNFLKTNRDLIVILTLTALVLVIYFQTTGFGFLNLDDNQYVYENRNLTSGLTWESVKWSFRAFYSANWHPLTWLSHAADIQMFGLSPGGHHAVNIFFHLLNSILAFLVFRRMTGSFWNSVAVAAIFAVHPAHIESVAWVSERKDVLSTMFWLLTMWAYVRFSEEAEMSEGVSVRVDQVWFMPSYLLVVLCFALGLMAKPMLVTLPFVLLLCGVWPLNRLRSLGELWRRMLDKLPLFALTIGSCVMTFLAQRSIGAVESLEFLPLGTRIVNALVSYAKYVGMFFYPERLAVWYPYQTEFPVWEIAMSIVLLAAITAFCIYQFSTRKYLLVGWLWFVGTLVPVIGIVQVGSQSMADRYTYVPYFGLLIMTVWGLSDFFEQFNISRKFLYAGIGAAVLIFTALSFQQTGYWHNSETLYRRTLAITTNNTLISHNLCHLLTFDDRLDEAEPFCRDAIERKPNYFEPYNTMGVLQFKRKDYAEAEKYFRKTLELMPNYPLAYSNLALAQVLQKRPEEAEASLQRAVQFNNGMLSDDVVATTLNDLAIEYASQQKYQRSAENLKRLLYLQPGNVGARTKLALTLYLMKQYDEAQIEAESVIRMNPNDPSMYNVTGLILMEKGDHAGAALQFEKALTIAPDFADAKANLAKAKAGK